MSNSSGFLSPSFLGQEEALVLELGSRVTRAGLAGESRPRVALASPRDLLSSEGALELHLKRLVRKLHVNLSECNVFLVEPFACSYREQVARVLFERLKVRALMFVGGPAAAALLAHPSYCVCVDVGARETRVLPLHEGSALLGAFCAAPLGLDHLEQRAQACAEGELRVLPRELSPNALKQQPPALLAEHAAEVWFEGDDDNASIASLLLRSVLRLPIDTRKRCCSNVLLLGGGAMLPGFAQRLRHEFDELAAATGLRLDYCPRKSAAFTPDLIQWLGVSAVATAASLLTFDDGLVTRAKWEENGLPDDFELK